MLRLMGATHARPPQPREPQCCRRPRDRRPQPFSAIAPSTSLLVIAMTQIAFLSNLVKLWSGIFSNKKAMLRLAKFCPKVLHLVLSLSTPWAQVRPILTLCFCSSSSDVLYSFDTGGSISSSVYLSLTRPSHAGICKFSNRTEGSYWTFHEPHPSYDPRQVSTTLSSQVLVIDIPRNGGFHDE